MKRGGPPRRYNQLRRGSPLRRQSAKRRAEQPARAAAVAAAIARDGARCKAADLVPEVECWGPLDPDEYELRGVRPGGHLDPTNIQMLCRAHHDWKHAEPLEAARRGLRPFPPGRHPH